MRIKKWEVNRRKIEEEGDLGRVKLKFNILSENMVERMRSRKLQK